MFKPSFFRYDDCRNQADGRGTMDDLQDETGEKTKNKKILPKNKKSVGPGCIVYIQNANVVSNKIFGRDHPGCKRKTIQDVKRNQDRRRMEWWNLTK